MARVGIGLGVVAVAVAATPAGCNSSGHPRRDVLLSVEGHPPPDWRSHVAPCIDPGWTWHVEDNPNAVPDGIYISVPPDDYRESRTPEILACLKGRPGVTRVDKPGFG